MRPTRAAPSLLHKRIEGAGETLERYRNDHGLPAGGLVTEHAVARATAEFPDRVVLQGEFRKAPCRQADVEPRGDAGIGGACLDADIGGELNIDRDLRDELHR